MDEEREGYYVRHVTKCRHCKGTGKEVLPKDDLYNPGRHQDCSYCGGQVYSEAWVPLAEALAAVRQ